MSKLCSPSSPEQLIPVLFSPGITDVIPDDRVQHFTYLKTGEPGFFDYNQLDHTLEGEGFRLVLYQPDWSSTPPSQWADDMAAAASWTAAPGEPLILGGFSFGALLAAQAAEKLITAGPDAPHVLGIKAVSLTCLFGKRFDHAMKQFPEDKESLLACRADNKPKLHPRAFDTLSSMQLPDIGDCPAHIYVGEHEAPLMKEVAALAAKRWARSKVIEVPGGGHDVTKPSDLAAIAANIGSFLLGAGRAVSTR
jgi:pimeloyl-ACP methyl ester carboxylesterase